MPSDRDSQSRFFSIPRLLDLFSWCDLLTSLPHPHDLSASRPLRDWPQHIVASIGQRAQGRILGSNDWQQTSSRTHHRLGIDSDTKLADLIRLVGHFQIVVQTFAYSFLHPNSSQARVLPWHNPEGCLDPLSKRCESGLMVLAFHLRAVFAERCVNNDANPDFQR
ncbi:hypothetical protein D3C86_1574740 [compost metagenome]